jgi:hypothetical protein
MADNDECAEDQPHGSRLGMMIIADPSITRSHAGAEAEYRRVTKQAALKERQESDFRSAGHPPLY